MRHDNAVFPRRFAELSRRAATGLVRPIELQSGGRTRGSECAAPGYPHIAINLGKYQARLSETLAEREAACRLRYRVFNVELGEGLASSRGTGIDEDRFDPFCDHLVVEDRSRGEVVGTYRMQPGPLAASNLGYYSEQEFDFRPYEPVRSEVLELGRAAIAREHRSSEVLTLLWRGIAEYARSCGLRYLIGCSSLNSCDAAEGWSIYQQLAPFLAPEEMHTQPTRAYQLPRTEEPLTGTAKVPKLLRTYIAVGARICAEPAWDREFGTIDFLTLLDLAQLSPAAKARFLPDCAWPGAPAGPLCTC